LTHHVFGIRHHGPGCARALRDALAALAPDIVLLEGPPDAEEVLALAGRETMRPPVALLIYPVEAPRRAVYYPFADFSPEWQALRWAAEHGVPARFMDLPMAVQMALEALQDTDGDTDEGTDGDTDLGDEKERGLAEDPLGLLAEAAGYTDRELWWEHQIEQRRDAAGLFEAILGAMSVVRAEARPHPDERVGRREERREAFMRQRIRAAQKEGFQKIAVVCGAWHAPVLAELGPAKPDQAILKDLPKTKVTATWIPWTHSRLSFRSGYGAGVASPGWYQHLWTSPDRAPVRWVTQAARLLRAEDLDASPASIIEAVRLAESLATMRDLPMPGLYELQESIRAVLCHGETTPMALIHDRLEIGEALGEVPEETPAVPLQKDLEAQQRRLRLKPSAEIQKLDLDLREENGRARSRLLHRLRLLNIPWGEPETARGKSGTFHELWQIAWSPELAVQVVEAGRWGTTVESAASALARDAGDKAPDLPAVTHLLDQAILAGLPEAIEHLLTVLRDRAAVAADVRTLMVALPPLARVARYGDVRETRPEDVAPVLQGIFERIVVGLPGACASLDDAAAVSMAQSLSAVQESLDLLDRADLQGEWREVLTRLLDADTVHGRVRGLACRLLLDRGALDAAELSRRASLALSAAVPAHDAAAWIEGLLGGSGLLLLHQDGLWSVLDGWLSGLSEDGFREVLPLLRRAFAEFPAPERRKMGEKVRGIGGTGAAPAPVSATVGDADLDHERADRVLPVLAHILGVDLDGTV
jgi:hypothetical protein